MAPAKLTPRFRLRWLALLIVWVAAPLFAPAADPPHAGLRVMSFNIRYGTASDGPNHWDRRRELVVQTIRDFQPDLLGTQETLGFQKNYLAGQFPEYEPFGVGRDDGGQTGEMAALFYRRDRFERLDGGHFWLSETPETPGSKSWDSSLPRICTWVKLRDQQDPQQRVLWFINTHFDHRGAQARLESVRLLHRWIEQRCGADAVVLTGDFNSGEGSPPSQALFAPFDTSPALLDTYRRVHPQRQSDEGSFNGFQPEAVNGGRIDWIAQRGWNVVSAEINRTSYDGRTPSDHWPVTAVLAPQE